MYRQNLVQIYTILLNTALKTRYFITIFLISAFAWVSHSQTTTQDTLTRSAPIFYDVLGNKVTYGATMPELNQIAGAPKAYYTYYWEFGDGNYSNEKNPQHEF